MPHSSRTEGFIVGFKASYNMNIAAAAAAAAAAATFKELRLSPSFPPLFQFSLYSSPNRLARDSLTRTGAAPLCVAARYSLVSLMRAYRPLVSGSSVAARIELSRCRRVAIAFFRFRRSRDILPIIMP